MDRINEENMAHKARKAVDNGNATPPPKNWSVDSCMPWKSQFLKVSPASGVSILVDECPSAISADVSLPRKRPTSHWCALPL